MPGRREARVWDLRADPLGSAHPQARRGSTQGRDSGRNWVEWSEGPDPQGMRPVTGVVPSMGLGLASGALPAECPFPDSSFLHFSPGLGGQLGGWGTRPGSRWGAALEAPARDCICPCHPQRVSGGGSPRARLGRAPGEALPRRPRTAAPRPLKGSV